MKWKILFNNQANLGSFHPFGTPLDASNQQRRSDLSRSMISRPHPASWSAPPLRVQRADAVRLFHSVDRSWCLLNAMCSSGRLVTFQFRPVSLSSGEIIKVPVESIHLRREDSVNPISRCLGAVSASAPRASEAAAESRASDTSLISPLRPCQSVRAAWKKLVPAGA